jgi:hypothetical protein
VGVPFKDVGGIASSGAVNLLFGARGSGITTANNQYLNQGSPGGLDAVEAQDQFGGRVVPVLHGNPWPSEPTPGGGGNQPPVLKPSGKTAEVGRPLTFTVTASDADGPGPLVLRTANLPAGATFEDLGNGRGAFNWVPPAGATANSPYSVTFSVTENGGSGLSDTEVVRITVVPASGGQGPYGGTPRPVPGKAEAENYDTGGQAVAYHDTTAANTGGQYRTDGVDIWKSATEGFYVGAIANGEWLEYTVNVATSGQYKIDLRVATPNSGRKIRLEMDGVAVGSVITLPSTGSWNTWQTVGATANLTSGRHVLRVVFVSGGFNFNWINIHR